MEIALPRLIPLALLLASLIFTSQARAAAPACDEPVALDEIVAALAAESLSEKIVGFKHREAGKDLDQTREAMACLVEPVTPGVVAELWYLMGMVELYEQTSRGVAEGAPMPEVLDLFKASLYVDELRAFDEARFGSYGKIYWDMALDSLTGAALIPPKRPVKSVGRVWIDGRGVSVVYNRPLRPGQHFVQQFNRGQWRAMWIEVSDDQEEVAPRSLFTIPADPILQIDALATGALMGCAAGGGELGVRVMPQGDRIYTGLAVGGLFGPSTLMNCNAEGTASIYNEQTLEYETVEVSRGLVSVPWRVDVGVQMPLPTLTVGGGIVYRGVVAQDFNRDGVAQRRGLGLAGDVLLGSGNLRFRGRAEVANLRRGTGSNGGVSLSVSAGLTWMFTDATSGRTGVN